MQLLGPPCLRSTRWCPEQQHRAQQDV